MTSKDLLDVAFVQKINLEALECNSTLEQKWKQYKKEFEDLQVSLEEFPKVLSASILMPLGSKVFLRAQLCNTNEIFIRHGEYFTKQTAYEAKAVCKRHINRCDGMIVNLSKEKQLLQENLYERHEISKVPEDLIEITEPYDEEEMNAWRDKHRQNVKEYKQKLSKQNKKVKDCNDQEENNDLITLKKAADDGWEALLAKIPDDSDDYSESESSDDEEDIEDDDEDDDDDDDDEEDSKIEIVFTNDVPENTSKLIKKRVSFNNNVEVKEFVSRPEEHFIHRREEIIPERGHPQILVTETTDNIIEDIVERITETRLKNENTDEGEEENARPVSRFKANRNKINIK